VRVEPENAEVIVASRKPLDRSDVRAAAATQKKRTYGEIGGHCERL